MSLKMRGQEVQIRVAVDGVIQGGSMFKSTDWTATPKTDLKEDDYLGEDQSDLDIQHNGWSFAFSVDTIDAVALDLLDAIIEREENHDTHPEITLTVIYTFREPGKRGKVYVYPNCFMKADEEGAGGRKEKHKVKFSGSCKRRQPLAA